MSTRIRVCLVFTIALCACFGASWFAVEPLREADNSWRTVRDKLVEQQDRAATLDPADPAGLDQLRLGLAEAEQLGEARRDEIANSAVVQILISIICAGFVTWIATSVSGRLTRTQRRPVRRGGLRPPLTPRRASAERSRPRVRETGSPEERVFIADRFGVLEYVNPTIARDFGRPREAIVGTLLTDLFGGGLDGALGSVLEGLEPTRSTAHLEVAVGDPAEPTWIALDIHARFDEEGSIAEIVGYGQDVSEERRARESVKAASENRSSGREGGRTLVGARVLVAASGRDHRRLIDFYLNQGGAKVTLVENGAEAIEHANAGEFELIVLDRRMPRTDGLEASRTLRREGYAGPILLLTNQSGAAERRLCLESGATEVVLRPLDRRGLIATIAAVLPQFEASS